ncbi:RING-box protein like [Actinidia chinensis var. chinensis]|uniref:RING-box protein like n=1 Tax=Actinidia chinensis var. chinensis TaxID=1590841 RepID=A0A2R6PT08_ACTCC|nr:RING-box protein like [Actinidia chinensis var. chinensis]
MRHRTSPDLRPLRRNLSASKSRSGTPSLSGLGISLWTTVRFAGTTSWISALNAKLIKLVPLVRSAPSLGVYAIMPSISTASVDGSKPAKCAHLITVNGNSRSTVTKACRSIAVELFKITFSPSVASFVEIKTERLNPFF